ncbi:MAG: UvrD-helicase domain-containing protein [Puniceicoccales bacterium]|nr:UvrD-helicase domain-containing protein [Puniceicoccales bacterium]
MNARVEHEAILASAGSGKTYQLSNRIAFLLAAGAVPSSILALTFTRRAAGEFSRRSISKIAAVNTDVKARAFAKELGLCDAEAWDAERFRVLLANVLRNLHRFRLGTFDNFFQNLARAAAFEIGLPGTFTLLDERGAALANARVLRRVFRREVAGRQGGGGVRYGDFLAAFRLATWGTEAHGVLPLLEKITEGAANLLRDFPDADAWGEPSAVFGKEQCPWLPVPTKEEVENALKTIDESADKSEGQQVVKALRKLTEVLREWEPGQPWDGGAFFEEKVLAVAKAEMSGGDTDFSYYKKRVKPSPLLAKAFVVVARYVIGGSIDQHFQMTRGIYALARRRKEFYEEMVCRAGLLTFADTEALLERRRTDVAFRLDATVHHWLFDEFQDTSRRQWGIVADNIDEVFSDTGGGRSAFFVGDVKQALYGWRGGAHTLLGEIRERYGEHLKMRPLDASWRSCVPVLALVNDVFGNLAASKDVLPEGTVMAWDKVWRKHTPAGEAQSRSGYAAWRVRAKVGRSLASGENVMSRLGAVVEQLREISPLERGFTCGLLTQTNAEAGIAAEFLRLNGVRVTSETDAPACEDNPVSFALLALLIFAAHPADGFHAGVVASTPALTAWIAASGGEQLVRNRLLTSIAENGFERTFQLVVDALGETLPHDAFSASRLRWLLDLAREFDASGVRDTDEFVVFARNSLHRDTDGSNSLRVMTIHKAKGLEFDLVFLPFLEGFRIDSPRREVLISADFRDDLRWVLSNPGNLVCEHTPVLSEHIAQRREKAAYEALCKFYVALTRAKRAVYLVTTAQPKENSGGGTNFPRLLERTLNSGGVEQPDNPPGIVWETGNRRWFEEVSPAQDDAIERVAPEEIVSAAPPVEALTPRRIFPRVLPSQSGTDLMRAGALFTGVTSGAAVGRCVHALLARVAFLSGADGEIGQIVREIADTISDEYDADSLRLPMAMVEAALRAPALHNVFATPASNALLWRERAFDVILNGAWVSGVFDRVVLSNNEAWLYDFKTDSDGAPAALLKRHAAQMALYRQALGKMTNFAPEKIHGHLIHVPDCIAVNVGEC